MNRVYCINGPNLGRLEWRDSAYYGDLTMEEIESQVRKGIEGSDLDLTWIQSDHEGALIEAVHAAAVAGASIVINPGALTHYSYALADALAMSDAAVIEVHLSNIYAREDWRRESVIAPVVTGSIAGLGPAGYLLAIKALEEMFTIPAAGEPSPGRSA